MKAENAWQAVLGQLQVEMPKAAFDTWVSRAELISYEDGSIIIGVPNAYARDWLDSRLASTVRRMLTGIMNRTIEVRFIVWQEENKPSPSLENLPFKGQLPEQAGDSNLNPRYSFSNFIVGASNRLAHAASMAVAEKPAQAYNPLFLYGGVGLGKTHLLHAIGNKSYQDGLQILYVSSEAFTNDLIEAIRTQKTRHFREKYRHIDVLLIDDIQFIAGKESTQEEFFHTFNALHGQNKQIVITSDRPPKALVTLEERLCSRFEWGLAADIQHPDFETRLAILQSNRSQTNVNLSDDILELIAHRVQSNIRELEGALTRVSAYSDLNNIHLSPQVVDHVLGDIIPKKGSVQPAEVIKLVAETFDIPQDKLVGRDRSRKIALPRQIVMYLLREESKTSLPQIGEILGGRDHTTIIYGCEKIADLIERDELMRSKVIKIKEQLYSDEKITQPKRRL